MQLLSRQSQFFPRILPEKNIPLYKFDTETKMILEEAEKLGISYEIFPENEIIALTYKGNTQYLLSRIPPTTSVVAFEATQDKTTTKMFLSRAKISTPKGYTILKKDPEDLIKSAWDDLEKSVVFKPTHGSHGNGIVTGITDWQQCKQLINTYFKNPLYKGGVLIEEEFVGQEYRIVATREKVVAVMQRVPAYITGDGKKTVEELIKEKNDLPIRNISHDVYPHITIDKDLIGNLKQVNLTVESVPKEGQVVTLRTVSNIMAGGEAIDRTDDIHPSVAEVVVKAVQSIPGLSWAGVDFMTTNIHQEQTSESYSIIELGALPEFAMHDMPMIGKKRNVTQEFLKLVFPNLYNF